MPDGNGDYLSRFERVEKTLERITQIQEVQARNLTSLIEVHQRQGQMLEQHTRTMQQHTEWLAGHDKAVASRSEKLDRVEILLAEMTAKVHFLIDREMKREGGPESLH
jgi:uncharacterized protein (DUF3084 family)